MHAPHVSPMPVRPWRSGAVFGPAHLCARALARDHAEDRGVYPFVLSQAPISKNLRTRSPCYGFICDIMTPNSLRVAN
jgi:hypothetical protein